MQSIFIALILLLGFQNFSNAELYFGGTLDISLGRDRRGVIRKEYKLNKTLQYYIENSLDENGIKKGLDSISEGTCFTFEKSTQPVKGLKGFNFKVGPTCNAPFGLVLQNKKHQNTVNLTVACSKNSLKVSTFTGMMLGLLYEQKRPERDDFVDVRYNRVDPYYLQVFDILPNNFSETFNLSYDFHSGLHVNTFDFNTGSKPVLKPRSYNFYAIDNIGAELGLNFNDKKVLNMHHCSDECTDSELSECQNYGYRAKHNCTKCICPVGFAGDLCDEPYSSPEVTEEEKRGYNRTANETIVEVKESGKKTVTYFITSREGYNVSIEIKNSSATPLGNCADFTSPQVKFFKDKGAGGFSLCSTYENFTIVTHDNFGVVMYVGKQDDSSMTFTYQEVNRTRARDLIAERREMYYLKVIEESNTNDEGSDNDNGEEPNTNVKESGNDEDTSR